MAGPLLSYNRGGRSHRRSPIHEINVTPFVDVMLVLLIVFMITAPLLTQGVQISLPEVENAPINESKEPIQVSIKNNGALYIQTQQVDEKDLASRLQAIQKARPNASILLRADRGISYGKVMEVMSALQMSGLIDVGLVTHAPGTQQQ
jgi:biopolymer transport protein TolR